MRIGRLRDQVVRVGAVFVVAGTAVLILRQQFVPASFGEQGHYRAEAVPAAVGLPIRYAGAVACSDCHSDEPDAKALSYHRGVACETCHGPSARHMEAPDLHTPLLPRERKNCLQCHAYLASRPTGFPQVIERLHNPMQACITCHDPHDPVPPHVPGACSACHALIARTKAVSPHHAIDCETCHEASPAHRESPRSSLPTKPTERAFCERCHAADADSARGIPRIDPLTHGGRYLCWQCHYPHYPQG